LTSTGGLSGGLERHRAGETCRKHCRSDVENTAGVTPLTSLGWAAGVTPLTSLGWAAVMTLPNQHLKAWISPTPTVLVYRRHSNTVTEVCSILQAGLSGARTTTMCKNAVSQNLDGGRRVDGSMGIPQTFQTLVRSKKAFRLHQVPVYSQIRPTRYLGNS